MGEVARVGLIFMINQFATAIAELMVGAKLMVSVIFTPPLRSGY
jgi:hypothetical protein